MLSGKHILPARRDKCKNKDSEISPLQAESNLKTAFTCHRYS